MKYSLQEMRKKSFWETHTLVAIDECRMDSDNRPTLKIGKEYKPEPDYLEKEYFLIFDEEELGNNEHYFTWGKRSEYFKVKRLPKKSLKK